MRQAAVPERGSDRVEEALRGRDSEPERPRREALTPGAILQLQRSGGNCAVAGLLRRVTRPTLQRLVANTPEEIAEHAKAQLAAAESACGMKIPYLSGSSANVSKAAWYFTPSATSETQHQATVRLNAGKPDIKEWYDRLAGRVLRGAKELIDDVMYWEGKLQEENEDGKVVLVSVQLLGSDLHERGLGAARVAYRIDYPDGADVPMEFVLKPEDRSLEKALLGTGGLASKLSADAKLGWGAVGTLGMDVEGGHGTRAQDVDSDPLRWARTIVRGFRNTLYAEDNVMAETIAFAYLTGMWDLHNENVLVRGGVPYLIDADVALRPLEIEEGLENPQAGFGPTVTKQVKGQLQPGGTGPSLLLEHARKHTDAVIEQIVAAVGDKTARALPVMTKDFTTRLSIFLSEKRKGKAGNEVVGEVTKIVHKGLVKEYGPSNISFDADLVAKMIRGDYDQGQIPFFHYKPQDGTVTYGGETIWKGKTIKDAMGELRKKLAPASEEAVKQNVLTGVGK